MIDVIELNKDGTTTTMPENGGGSTSGGQGQDAAPTTPNDLTAETAPGSTPGEQGGSAPQSPGAPPSDGASLAASQPEGEDADVPDDAATIPFVNRRIKQLNAKYRETEKQLADERQQIAEERQQNALRQAQLEARLDTLTRVMSGAAPALPEAPAQPTGPPQAEQYASHEDYVLAAARYGAQQELQARDQQTAEVRQREQQLRFQQDLMSREETFKQAHPDFDSVVRGGLAGKVSPVLRQALMLVPDGPAVAYALARQPDLVARLNTLPPPLVLVELGRLSPAPTASPQVPAGGVPTGTTPTPAAQATPPLPEPMAPVGGGGSMVQPVYSDGMNQAEYERYRARTSQLPYVRRS